MKVINFLCFFTVLVYFLSSILPIASFSQQSSGEDFGAEKLSPNSSQSKKLQDSDKNPEQETFLPRERAGDPDIQGRQGFLDASETFDSSESVKKFLSSFAILLIFLLLIFFVVRSFQKKKKNRFGKSWGSNVVEVLQQSSISPTHSIQLVQIAEKIYILATSQSNVSLIRVVEDPQELRELRELSEKEKGNSQEYRGFGEILHSYLPRGWKKSVPWGFHSMDLLKNRSRKG